MCWFGVTVLPLLARARFSRRPAPLLISSVRPNHQTRLENTKALVSGMLALEAITGVTLSHKILWQ